ncbi:hypothetical protein ACHAXR_003444 [Thalassiosira sp. AJA248-18]
MSAKTKRLTTILFTCHLRTSAIRSPFAPFTVKSQHSQQQQQQSNMGKKSRKPKSANSTSTAPPSATSIPSAPAASPAAPTAYPSDGPSEEELVCVQTTSQSLQAKLDHLVDLIAANDRAGFVSKFVPLDLSEQDASGCWKSPGPHYFYC